MHVSHNRSNLKEVASRGGLLKATTEGEQVEGKDFVLLSSESLEFKVSRPGSK